MVIARCRRWAEHGANELEARTPGQIEQADVMNATRRERIRMRGEHLRAREADEEERKRSGCSDDRVEELHARCVAPLEIVDHHDERAARALGAYERDDRATHEVSVKLRVA